jgi:hypothetical protein
MSKRKEPVKVADDGGGDMMSALRNRMTALRKATSGKTELVKKAAAARKISIDSDVGEEWDT